MEGNGGRNGRRNDSISSVMSVDNNNNTSSWTDDNNAPDSQRSSRAENTHLQELDHEASAHMLSQYASDDPSYMDASNSSDADHSSYVMSDLDYRHAIFELLDQMPETAEVDLVTPYQMAAMLPPITQDSLCELDVGRIINNPKLRHDVNFDRELHFRPNLDGSRGRQKLRSADEYWKALLAELQIYRNMGFRLMMSSSVEEQEYCERMIRANQIRLPGIFTTIYEVLKTLVPERDQAIIAERLDVQMIMQQISKGVFNMLDLTQWLATVLKAHCAPMRDEWIDQMVEQTTRGVLEGDQKAIAIGLRQTLAILEAMKLDVANHQIRHLRSLLIEDTINFQQKYHRHRVESGRFKIDNARAWFKSEESYLAATNTSATPLEIFTSAVLRTLLLQNSYKAFPETFHLDSERLRILRTDFHNLIQMELCCDAFDLFAKEKLDEETRAAGKKTLQANIADIIGESRHYLDNVENISAEIVRLVLQLEGAALSYDSDMMSIVEHHLRTQLPASSPAFGTQLETIFNTQLSRLSTAVKSRSRLPLLALHDTMLPPIQPAAKRASQKTFVESPMDEVLKRVTHLAILHWLVWAPLVYDVQGDGCFSRSDTSDNDHDPSKMNANTASAVSPPSTPEMQNQNGGFVQPSGPSITNGRPQE